MRKLASFLILTLVGGCGHCGHCLAAPPCEVQAGLMLGVVDPSAKPKLIDAKPCPAGVANCPCGCVAGKPCTCSQPTTRHPDPNGSGDYGYWRGDVLVGRWFAATNTFRFYADGKYGPPVACAAQPIPRFPVTNAMFGGCAGGSCRGR